ncbi:LOW QUALITY PROTEIN: interleukin-22 receptor subunit alpha-2 [Thalassophryne amazonica]|uniref:LOW QUALITY PROTEIN: interleukin-22 receptor subunit alpha-2 n=1 Tax=Thalassophryne amazonica TaxID=390379 RepID=UPI0014719EA6|nr:LOW QUALITY PROTEIN: interleukin-22 receptor subunit alpha-2 [Thalassophryne amazonica]
MSRLLLGALLLGKLCVCLTATEILAPPANVMFDSVDYKNVLRWNATNSSLALYYVQWKIYGEPQWLDVNGCQGIRNNSGDVSDVTSDPREWYYARVQAYSVPSSKSTWSLSPRFSPRWDTKISPPVLKLNITRQEVVIRVRPPRMLVRKIHKVLYYKIYVIHSSGKEEVFKLECCSRTMTLRRGSRYCIQAQTILPLQGRSSNRSSKKCDGTQ